MLTRSSIRWTSSYNSKKILSLHCTCELNVKFQAPATHANLMNIRYTVFSIQLIVTRCNATQCLKVMKRLSLFRKSCVSRSYDHPRGFTRMSQPSAGMPTNDRPCDALCFSPPDRIRYCKIMMIGRQSIWPGTTIQIL